MARFVRGRRLVIVAGGLGLAVTVALVLVVRLVINTPPAARIVIEPPETVTPLLALRLELAPFYDSNGDAHQATDWEIRSVDNDTLVWAAYGSPVANHLTLADGIYQGPQAPLQRLNYQTLYRLRVRSQDRRGAWSAWTESRFLSPATAQVAPRRLRGILSEPAPQWRADGDAPLSLPNGARLMAESASGDSWLTLTGDGTSLTASSGPILDYGDALRLRLTAPAGAGLALAASRLELIGLWADRAERLTLFLPAFNLPAGGSQLLWVSETGATFYSGPNEGFFNRERLARDNSLPWQLPDGYRVEVVSAALQLPTSLAFVANPGNEPNGPRVYVTELYGRLKVITNSGRVLPVAERLLNLTPTGAFPGTGELGVVGVCLPPTGRDIYVTMVYRDQANSLRNKLVRLRSDDGLTVKAIEDILVVRPGQGVARAAHQIQQCGFGPDGKLYVTLGDGTEPANAQSDRSFHGKLLRLNADGSAPSDNPNYDPAQPTAPLSYWVTKGHRNPFGLTWRVSDGQLYLSENGPNVDRLVRVVPGRNYGWDGGDDSMRSHALYTWPESRWAPTGLAFIEGPGAASLGPELNGRLVVGSSGLVYADGTMHAGKSLQVFTLTADGAITEPPGKLARYVGEGYGTVVDVKLQADGLYFTTLFQDEGDGGSTAPGGQLLRLTYQGRLRPVVSVERGVAPLTVGFGLAAQPAGASDCRWRFGDGDGSAEAASSYVYQRPGHYAAAVSCRLADGRVIERLQLIVVTTADGSVPPATGRAPVALPSQPAATSFAFPETGVGLSGGFKRFWETRGGLRLFGYPVTGVLRERNPLDGQEYTVQYFERVRLEARLDRPEEVRVGQLSRQLNGRRLSEPAFTELTGHALEATPGRRLFGETKHSLSEPFLTFWEGAGGLEIFGAPISEPVQEVSPTDGRRYLVQYFERARMEYHPELAGTVDVIRLARYGILAVVSQPVTPNRV